MQSLDPGASPVIEDNTNEIILNKDEEEPTGASSGKEERNNDKDKDKQFVYSLIKVLI